MQISEINFKIYKNSPIINDKLKLEEKEKTRKHLFIVIFHIVFY